MDVFNFDESEKNNWKDRKFRDVNLLQCAILPSEIIQSEYRNGKFLYTKCEKQLYTATDFGIHGKIYRCQDRKCPARVIILPTGQCVRLPTAKQHNHDWNCDGVSGVCGH